MKVLLCNGSPRAKGCTFRALSEIAKVLEREGIETEILQVGVQPIRDCIGCGRCRETGRCAFEGDVVNEWLEKAAHADGFVFGSPVYYAHPSGQLLSAMDRLFMASNGVLAHKPAAAVVTARRAGTSASLDAIQKHFLDNEMPVVSSTYWNMVFRPGEKEEDEEGLQTMRNIGRNMAWLLRCLQAGKEKGVEPPVAEHAHWTNFNR